MRILADEAAGGDMAKLDKMFEEGSLHTAKYLPLVLKRMKDDSDKMMEEYRKSLPYYRQQADRQKDLWLRSFTESGGEAGLNNFWQAWIQILEDSYEYAETFGRGFKAAARTFSGLALIPSEFARWQDGEKDSRNMFQSIFGDYERSELQEAIGNFKEAGDIIRSWGIDLRSDLPPKSFSEFVKNTIKEINGIVVGASNLSVAVTKKLDEGNRIERNAFSGVPFRTSEDEEILREAKRRINSRDSRTRSAGVAGIVANPKSEEELSSQLQEEVRKIYAERGIGQTLEKDGDRTLTGSDLFNFQSGVPILSPQGNPYSGEEVNYIVRLNALKTTMEGIMADASNLFVATGSQTKRPFRSDMFPSRETLPSSEGFGGVQKVEFLHTVRIDASLSTDEASERFAEIAREHFVSNVQGAMHNFNNVNQ